MTRVAALIALLMVVVFLGWLALSIASIPLAVIIAIGIVFVLADFYHALRRPES
jgi:hypothetical protein